MNSKKVGATMEIKPGQLFALVGEELERVEQSLLDHIDTEVAELAAASVHLIRGGGKRMRPAFALLIARMFNEAVESVIPMATALEMVHMATLVHDDVIDDSLLRRGRPTVKAAWGNRISIYAGNYILARALSLVAAYQRRDLVEVLAQASMEVCKGEFRQMESVYQIEQPPNNYLHRIQSKTALLIAVSCRMGAMLSSASPLEVQCSERYGRFLGMAFQITDDVLDYVADEATLGKPVGSDIRQGIITLPALYALRFSSRRENLRSWIVTPELCEMHAEAIVDEVIDSGGIDYALELAGRYADKARQQLNHLPPGAARESLVDIADFVVQRSF